MNESTASVRDIIVCLSDQPQWMKLLLGNGKKYSKLIDYLLEDPYFMGKEEGDFKTATVKRYAEELGEKTATVNKWLREIYDDIFSLNETNPKLFVREGETRVGLAYCTRREDSCFYFTIGMPVIPREYEQIEFYFMKARYRAYSFIVKKVEHRISQGTTEIDLMLEDSFRVSRYQDLLAEKAEMLGMLSIEESFEDGYNLRQILLRRFHRDTDMI